MVVFTIESLVSKRYPFYTCVVQPAFCLAC